MDSRHAQKSAPSVRPRSPRWKAWQCASTKPGSCNPSVTRERICACCGASWSWGWQGRVLALPALARAGTVAIFYYPWYGTPATDGAWQHWSQNEPLAAGRPLLALLPGARPVLVERRARRRAADGADRRRRRRRGRRLLVGPRLDRGCAAAARHLRCAPARAARRDPPRAVRRALARDRRAGPLLHRGARRARRLRLPPERLRGVGLGDAPRSRRHRRCGCSPRRTASASPPPPHFDGVYTYDFSTYGGGKFARLCAQAHAMHLVCAPSVGPGLQRTPGR